jgi:spermidine synthase
VKATTAALLVVALTAAGLLGCHPRTDPQKPANVEAPAGSASAAPARVLFETRSSYSHIKVVDAAGTRTLLFVHDDGTETIQSRIRLSQPDELEVPYTQVMMASFLFRPEQKRCLIVGLGGGSMVRFLNHFFPEVTVDVVEIDPAIVKVAKDYFGVTSSSRATIINADGAAYLETTDRIYDVIYLDAFLRVGPETDVTGAPRSLKTERFLRQVQQRLVPEGLIDVNLHDRATLPGDIATLRKAFPNVYVYPVPGTGNVIAMASLRTARFDANELAERGRQLDQQRAPKFSFEKTVGFEKK